METSAYRELLKSLLAEGALAALIIYGICVRQRLQTRMWPILVALILIGAGSVASYYEFGWVRYGRFMNPHDFYHYYTGAKYAPEIGYYNQYAASLLADLEGKKVYDTKQPIRNLATHGYTPVKDVLANKDAIKGRFTPERWEEFKQDIVYFQSLVPKGKWQEMLRDKGYNGTPVWSMIAGVLTNLIPTSSKAGMQFLVALDPLILLGMFLLIWRAFGPWCALFALAFFGTNFALAFVHIKGALMRMDWVACLVASMCLLHLKHYKSAGAVLAYAAAARIFPAIFAFGIGALLCWEFIATRKWNKDYLRFFASFAATALVMVLVAYVYYGSPLWKEFFAKISVHNDDISSTRVGFKYLFLWPYAGVPGKTEGFLEHQTLWRGILAAVLALSFVAVRRMKPYQALGLGFVPAFFLTAPTFYYYVMLIVPLLVFLPEVEAPRNNLGAVLFFATSLAAYIMHYTWNLGYELSIFLSCLYLLLALYMLAAHLIPQRLPVPVLATTISGPTLVAMAELPGEEPASPQTTPPVPTTNPASAKASVASAESGTLKLPFPARYLMGLAYAGFLLSMFLYYRGGGAPEPGKSEPARTAVQGELKEATETPEETEDESTPDAPDAEKAAPPAPTPVAATTPPAPAASDTVTISLVGDIMLSRNVAKDLATRNLDFTYPFKEAAPLLLAADIAFGNLECPISGRGEAMEKKFLFNASPDAVKGLTFAGFDLVSVANNHTLDYGAIAMDDTLRILGENNVLPLGATTSGAPQQPVIIERKGIRVGFLGYADPQSAFAYPKEFMAFDTRPASADKDAIARDIAALTPNADIIVVSFHWGTEYEKAPDVRQTDLAQFAIDQGADIVAGHHPHVQQDATWYKNGLIIYSMGNFVFDQWSRPETLQSRLYTVRATKAGLTDAQFRPMALVAKDWQPKPTGPNAVQVPRP